MKITRVDIDGFGVFSGLTIPDFAPGVSVFYGDNEAGKTTLLSFFRYVLFGFPYGKNRSRENPYPPANGGTHGGRVTVKNGNGDTFIIERVYDKRGGRLSLTMPDGSAGTSVDLENILGSASYDLYQNIFAFTLWELSRFESLDGDQAKAAIYSAGTGTGAATMMDIDKNIADRRTELLKKRGDGEINRILRKLDEIKKAKKLTDKSVEEYDEIQRELNDLEESITGLSRNQTETQARLNLADLFIAAWDDWHATLEAQRRLETLPPTGNIPPGGVARLEKLRDNIIAKSAAIQSVNGKIDALAKERDAIEINTALQENADTIARLQQGRKQYESAKNDLPDLSSRIKSETDTLEEGLRDLGPDWDVDRLDGFNTSTPERELIRRLGAGITEARDKAKSVATALNTAKKTRDDAKEVEARAKSNLDAAESPSEKDMGALRNRKSAVAKAVELLREKSVVKTRLRNLYEQDDYLRPQCELLKPYATVKERDSLLLFFILFGVGAITGAALLFDGFRNAGLFIALCIVIAVVMDFALRRRFDRTSEERAAAQSQLATLMGMAHGVQSGIAETEASIKTIDEKLAAICAEAGIPVPDNESAASTFTIAIDDDMEKLRQWKALESVHQEARILCDKAGAEFDKAMDAAKLAEGDIESAVAEWKSWLATAGLRDDISPEGASEILGRIESLRMRKKNIADLRNRAALVEKTVDDFTAGVKAIYSLDEPFDTPLVALDKLHRALELEKKKSAERDGMEKRVAELREELMGLQPEKAELEKAVDEILARVSAVDDDDFRRMARIADERMRLVEEIKRRTAAVEKITGRGDTLEKLQQLFADSNPAAQQTIADEAEAELRGISESKETLLSKKGGLLERLGRLQTGDERARLLFDEQGLVAQLRKHVTEWRVLTAVKTLLDKTRERYEKERQPAVIRDASAFFERITDGKYQRIITAPGKSELELIDDANRRKPMEILSRGAMEQLYLAMRLGLIQEFNSKREPLPVIMDDVFVNFDMKRAEAAVHAVAELSRENQIIIFTCHPETAEVIRRADPQVTLYRISGGALQRM